MKMLAWIALLLGIAAGVQTYRLVLEQRDHALTRAGQAKQVAKMEEEARKAEAAARAEERRRANEMEEIARATQQELIQARADAEFAADAGGRLRQRVAALTASCRGAASNSAVTSGSEAAGAAGDLLADVQRRLDEAADGIARHGDEARIAGGACERAYDALAHGL